MRSGWVMDSPGRCDGHATSNERLLSPKKTISNSKKKKRGVGGRTRLVALVYLELHPQQPSQCSFSCERGTIQ